MLVTYVIRLSSVQDGSYIYKLQYNHSTMDALVKTEKCVSMQFVTGKYLLKTSSILLVIESLRLGKWIDPLPYITGSVFYRLQTGQMDQSITLYDWFCILQVADWANGSVHYLICLILYFTGCRLGKDSIFPLWRRGSIYIWRWRIVRGQTHDAQ